jgi:high-affinity iron transporter
MLGEGEETQWSLPLYSLMIMSAKDWRPIVANRGLYGEKQSHERSLIRQSVIVALFASVITCDIPTPVHEFGASRELLGNDADCRRHAVLHELLVTV